MDLTFPTGSAFFLALACVLVFGILMWQEKPIWSLPFVASVAMLLYFGTFINLFMVVLAVFFLIVIILILRIMRGPGENSDGTIRTGRSRWLIVSTIATFLVVMMFGVAFLDGTALHREKETFAREWPSFTLSDPVPTTNPGPGFMVHATADPGSVDGEQYFYWSAVEINNQDCDPRRTPDNDSRCTSITSEGDAGNGPEANLFFAKPGSYSVMLYTSDHNFTNSRVRTVPIEVKGTTTTPGTVTTADCGHSWKMEDINHANNRFAPDGVPEIKGAMSDDQAKAAAQSYLGLIKVDPSKLSGATSHFLFQAAPPTSTLVDANGCATTKAVEYAGLVENALVVYSRSITVEDAPTNGTNSGVDENGEVVVAAQPGITGDRKAIKIVLESGKTVWILARCGNFVTLVAPPGVPTGPTDQLTQPAPETVDSPQAAPTPVTTQAPGPTAAPRTPVTTTDAPVDNPRTPDNPVPSTPKKSAHPQPSDAPDPADRGNGTPPPAQGPPPPAAAPTTVEPQPEIGNPAPADGAGGGEEFPTD